MFFSAPACADSLAPGTGERVGVRGCALFKNITGNKAKIERFREKR
jgi:hypothetical protein